MNIYVPNLIAEKYPNFEFIGKPFNKKGRTLIEAKSHATGITHYYSFEEDFLWHANCELPDWMMKTK
jgi:hypothetical protein